MKKKPGYLLIAAVFLLLAAGALFAAVHTHNLRRKAQEILTLADENARTHWLGLHGWQAGEPAVSETVVPTEWVTDAGQHWLAIQHSLALTPENFAGEPAVRYTYPLAQENLRAELLLCGDVLIGAQIYDLSDGSIRSVCA